MEEDVVTLLKSRGVEEQSIQKLKENKVDKYVIPLITDEDLKEYLPFQGDRIALKEFCKLQDKKSVSSRKNTLINSLRRKLFMKSKSSESEEEVPVKKSHLAGNKNAKKQTRKIELGWLNFDPLTSSFKQVRKMNGGGTRKLDMDKDTTKKDLMEKGKAIFFKDGFSKLGSIENFKVEIRDFSEELLLSEKETVGEMYDRTGMTMLRFFIATTFREEIPDSEIKSIKDDNEEDRLPQMTLIKSSSLRAVTKSVNTNPTSSFTSSTDDTTTPQSSTPLHDTKAQTPNSSIIPYNTSILLPFDNSIAELPDIAPLFSATISVPSPPLDESENEIFFRFQEDGEILHTTDNNSTLPYEPKKNHVPLEMNIHRGSMALMEMICYFKDPSIMNRELTITRILPTGQREQAEDTGGVLRDILSEFWAELYEKCTVGRLVKVPCLRHDFATAEWKSVARILSYGYTNTGYWPVKLTKTFILNSIIPDFDPPSQDLMADFYNYISIPDGEVFKKATEDFQNVDKEDLADALDMHECRSLPKEDTIKAILLEIAHKEILQAPNFISDCWKDIFHDFHIDQFKVNEIYENLIPSNKKVLQILSFPESMDNLSSEVSKHLKRYVKNLDEDKLAKFLRFCTGSDLLINRKIEVEFIIMTGLQRRPISHTCGCVLQLSKVYESYMDFRSEFDNVLSGNVWVMDIV